MSVARFLIEITINVPFSLFSFFSPPWNVGEQATVIDISHFISCWYISRVKAYRDGQRRRLFYMCYTCFEKKYWWSIPTLDRTQRAWIFSIYAHCLFNGCCDSTWDSIHTEDEFLVWNMLDATTWLKRMQQVYIARRRLPVE